MAQTPPREPKSESPTSRQDQIEAGRATANETSEQLRVEEGPPDAAPAERMDAAPEAERQPAAPAGDPVEVAPAERMDAAPEAERQPAARLSKKAERRPKTRIERERDSFIIWALGVVVALVTLCCIVFWGFDVPIKFTQRWAFIGALVIMALLTVGIHGLLVRVLQAKDRVRREDLKGHPQKVAKYRRSGLKALFIGIDGRGSTSQTQVILWTYAVLYAGVVLLLLGHSPNCPATGLKSSAFGIEFDCPSVNSPSSAFPEAFGARFPPEYLVLIGLPVAAFVSAKKITGDRVKEDPNAKPPNDDPEKTGLATTLAEVVSSDWEAVSVANFQYFVFNLFALAYFFTQLLTHPELGLPEIPSALLVLTGVSSASYVAAKQFDPRKAEA
jgi:hypothetical protein